MVRALKQLECLARNRDVPILIEGETGTGKTMVARHLHAVSPRASGPFQHVQLAAVEDAFASSELFGHVAGAFTGARGPRAGAFLSAQHGTVFLDEIGKASSAVQRKLLHAVEQCEITPLGSDRSVRVDALANDVAGVYHSCAENTVCKWGGLAVATYTGARLAMAAYAWLAGAGAAAGTGLTDRIADALERAGPDMTKRLYAVLDEIPDHLTTLMTTNPETGAITISGGAGNRLREIILNTDGSSIVKAFNATTNAWITKREIFPPQ